ncbi:MAG: MXAN_5187 C-terminal domain-containing protein [Pseudomonadota bacterium]
MRWRIGLGILLVTGLGLGLKLRLLSGLIGEETLRTVAAIDAAVAVLLLIFSVAILTGHLSYLRELVRHLHIVVGGRRDLRMPVRGDGVAADLGHGINELLGSVPQDEGLSSSTPGIRRVVRPGEATDPKLRARILGPVGRALDTPEPGADFGEGVGPVRVRPRDASGEPSASTPPTSAAAAGEVPRFDTEVSGPPDQEQVVEPSLDMASAEDSLPPSRTDGRDAGPGAVERGDEDVTVQGRPESGAGSAVAVADDNLAPSDDEDLPVAPAADLSASDSSVPFASAVSLHDVPALDDVVADARRDLFEAYLSAKKRLGEDVAEVTYQAFDQQLDDLEVQLKAERGCDDVRFNVRVVDGRVALQPRLVRNKAQVS